MPNHPDPASRPARPVRRGGMALWLAVGLAVAAAGGVTALTLAVRGGAADAPRTADLVPAQRLSFDITTTATGDLQARNQIEVRSRLDSPTTITYIVPEGTRVKAGDVLVRLNSEAIQTEIDEGMLTVESARAELIAAENAYEIQKSENDSRLRQAQLKVELAGLSLEQWKKGEVEQKRKDLELALENTKKDLERLQDKFKRSQDLFDKGFLSKNERDLDEIALRKAEAEYEKAVLANETYWKYQYPMDLKQKESDLAEAQAELERVKAQNEIELASKEADRVNRRRQLQMREERLAHEQEQLAACTLTAPQDGLVVYWSSARGADFIMFDSRGPLQVGRQVMPQEPLIALPDTSEMMAVVRIHESLAGRIEPGQRATVKVDAVGGRAFPGRVESIGVLAESGGWRDPNRREYTVKIALDLHDPATAGLKPSMRCEAEIMLARAEDALAVPIQAVFNDGPVRYIYTPRSGKFARVPVKVGRRSETHAEIVAGLEPGTRVLVRQPEASEILQAAWDPDQLRLVGLTLGEDGHPRPIETPGTPAMAGGRAIVVPGNGAPGAIMQAAPADGSATTLAEAPAEPAGAEPASAETAATAPAADGGTPTETASATDGDATASPSPQPPTTAPASAPGG